MIQYIRESWDMATPSEKKMAKIGLALVGLFLIAVLWSAVKWSDDTGEDAEESGELATGPRLSVSERLAESGYEIPMGIAERSLLDQHFAALGGFETISSVSSLRFAGKVQFSEDLTQDVVVVKKGGDRARITIKSKLSQTSVCVSPEDNWKAFWNRENLIKVEDLSPEEVEDQMRYIYVVSELFLALEKGWSLEYEGVREFDYKMAHVFEVRPDERHYVRFFIDPETFLDIGREDKVFLDDGTLEITRRINSEHFQASKLTIPGKVETYVDGKLVQTVFIQSGTVNAGVLDTVFTRPTAGAKP
jgi:hypothetical protein